MSISKTLPLFLSDGTPVTFVKVTSRGNLQVRLPDSHPFAEGQDNGRIFRSTDGAHYKGATNLTLTNEAPTSAAAVEPGPVDHTLPMFLSDGTPVTFSKKTRRGRIQVVLPNSHAEAAGQDNGLLYESTTGARYKNRSAIFLTNTAPAAGATASAPASDDTTYGVSVGGSLIAEGLASFDEAESAAIAALSGDVRSADIVATSTKVVGTVGVASTRS